MLARIDKQEEKTEQKNCNANSKQMAQSYIFFSLSSHSSFIDILRLFFVLRVLIILLFFSRLSDKLKLW